MLTIDNLVNNLFENFPDFKETSSYEDDELLPYNIIGDFSIYFQSKFIASKLSSSQVDIFFNFANEMAESEDLEVNNIFVVEVLELFSDRSETIDIARKKLRLKGRDMLEKVLKGWR